MQEEMFVSYFWEYASTNQCEFAFNMVKEFSDLSVYTSEIKVCLPATDTLSSLVRQLKINVNKAILDGRAKTDKIDYASTAEEDKENDTDVDLYISFRRGAKEVSQSTILSNFLKNIHGDVHFHLFDKKFTVIVNAPVIREIKLPLILFSGCTTQPQKFRSMYNDKQSSQFFWYKSRDKINWEKVGTGFRYHIRQQDINNYLKIECIPYNKAKIKGPSAMAVSDFKVERMGDLPICPFEGRHNFTKNKLRGKEFRVVCYNILSDRYVNIAEYSYCSPRVLSVDYRKQLILKEIRGYNADIICLQELDHFQYSTFFKEEFKQLGYNSLYNKKGNCNTEGLATVYDNARFKRVDTKHIVLSTEIQRSKLFSTLWKAVSKNADFKNMFLKQQTSLQVTVLKTEMKRKFIIIANTHLYYHPDANHVRLVQVNMATTYINMLKRRYMKDSNEVSVIFCGDFNSNPNMSVYPFMLQGSIDPYHEDCMKISENGDVMLYHDFLFESACGEPLYTNYTPDFKGCLDYIFIESNKMTVTNQVPLPEEEELSKHEGLPNDLFPSDHLALVVDLKLKY